MRPARCVPPTAKDRGPPRLAFDPWHIACSGLGVAEPMTADTLEPAARHADAALPLFCVVSWLSRRLRVEVNGIENVPSGRALLVSNHSFGVDSIFPMSAVRERLQRPVSV